MSSVFKTVLIGSTAGVALLGTSAIAQTTPPETEQSDANSIVVTATRQAKRLEEVPAAISVVNSEQLARSNVVKFADIAQLAAGVQVQKGGYTTQPAVRGITSLTTGVGFEPNTALYIDGFYQSDSIAINADFANVSQIEILKGPQGTLYGRNATSGAILITTIQPNSNAVSGELNVSYARFNDRSIRGYINLPLGSNAAFSVAGSFRRSDGWVKDLGTDGKGTNGYPGAPAINDTVRAKLKVQAADWLTFTAGYNYIKVLDAIAISYTQYAYVNPVLPAPPLRATEPDTVTNNGRPDNTATVHEGTLLTSIDTGGGKLELRTSYDRRTVHQSYDFDGSKLDLFRGEIPVLQHTFQQAADFSTKLGKNIDLLIGGLYFHDNIDVLAQKAFINGAVTTTDNTHLRARSWAGYVDATYHTGPLSLTGGVRYSTEHKSVAYDQIAAAPVLPGSGEATFSKLTPRLIARYELAPRTNVYASFSTGFRTGVFQNQVLPNPAFEVPIKPETITAYEVGFKTASGGFRFDAAAFYYVDKNLHIAVNVTNPITGVGTITVLNNAKAAEVYGAEAQVAATPMPNWNVSASVSLLHARYTDFHNATANGLNITTQRNVSNQPQDWTGQQMARAPSFSATFQTDYTFPLANGKLQLALNANYSASYVVSNPSLYGPLAGPDLANKQRYRQGAYAMMNIQANWTDPSDHLTIGVFVNNVTNTRYLIVTSGGTYGDYRNFSQPVQAGVRARVRY